MFTVAAFVCHMLSSVSASPYRNIGLLSLAWALTLTTSTLLTTVGPLSASSIGGSSALSAFTIGIFLIGAASSSVPSGWLFRRYGRFGGFTVGCMCQVIGSILGTWSILQESMPILFCGCFCIGLGQGLGQFYRFSAVELSPPGLKDRAVTYVLTGGIIAAFLGPTCAAYSKNLFGTKYEGSYAVIALIAVANEMVLMLVKFPPPVNTMTEKEAEKQEKEREETEKLIEPSMAIAGTAGEKEDELERKRGIGMMNNPILQGSNRLSIVHAQSNGNSDSVRNETGGGIGLWRDNKEELTLAVGLLDEVKQQLQQTVLIRSTGETRTRE